MKTFYHGGDAGDIIWSLPAIRALGGGILYLDAEGGLHDPLVKWAYHDRTKLNEKSIESLATLLRQQDYILEVVCWDRNKKECLDLAVNYNLNKFRKHIKYNNVADSHLAAFNLSFTERDKAWLTVDNPIKIPGKDIVITRSPRVQGNHSFWEERLPPMLDRCIFVGFPKEHEYFEYTFDFKVDYYPTETILDLARVIAGAELFVSNQTLAHAIAEGFKKNIIHEMYKVYPCTVFNREGVWNV